MWEIRSHVLCFIIDICPLISPSAHKTEGLRDVYYLNSNVSLGIVPTDTFFQASLLLFLCVVRSFILAVLVAAAEDFYVLRCVYKQVDVMPCAA